MPELPEVETIVRDLNKSLLGKIFSDVVVHDAFVLRQESKDFIKRLKSRVIKNITRRGKAIIVHLGSEDFLVVQVIMTGQLVIDGPKEKHTRITFVFSDGSKLLYNDQRRFGQLRVVGDLKEITHFTILGPEPFSKEFTPAYMLEAFQRKSRPIKNVLLDHTFVAGIGNIYACEILFRCGIDPKRFAKAITRGQSSEIHQKIIEVLKEAIKYRGSSMRNYRDASGDKGNFKKRIQVYAREDEPCLFCKTPIKRIVQAGRSTFYCRQCQK